MRCPICDSDSDTVTLTDPCGVCQEVIYDTVQSYPKIKGVKSELDEEELLEDFEETKAEEFEFEPTDYGC